MSTPKYCNHACAADHLGFLQLRWKGTEAPQRSTHPAGPNKSSNITDSMVAGAFEGLFVLYIQLNEDKEKYIMKQKSW